MSELLTCDVEASLEEALIDSELVKVEVREFSGGLIEWGHMLACCTMSNTTSLLSIIYLTYDVLHAVAGSKAAAGSHDSGSDERHPRAIQRCHVRSDDSAHGEAGWGRGGRAHT